MGYSRDSFYRFEELGARPFADRPSMAAAPSNSDGAVVDRHRREVPLSDIRLIAMGTW
jgi:hypothetical protein